MLWPELSAPSNCTCALTHDLPEMFRAACVHTPSESSRALGGYVVDRRDLLHPAPKFALSEVSAHISSSSIIGSSIGLTSFGVSADFLVARHLCCRYLYFIAICNHTVDLSCGFVQLVAGCGFALPVIARQLICLGFALG